MKLNRFEIVQLDCLRKKNPDSISPFSINSILREDGNFTAKNSLTLSPPFFLLNRTLRTE